MPDKHQPLMNRRDLWLQLTQPAAPEKPVSGPNYPPRSLTLPPLEIIALNRMGFGPRPGDIDAFRALGATPEDQLAAYIEQQLDPDNIDDSDLDTRITASAFITLNKTLEDLWLDHVVNNADYTFRMLPEEETERAAFTRALHSKRQLAEVLADFWHNHFNVYGRDYSVGPVFVHYDRDVIRAHMLGNFRVMLEAVAKSTAMLFYLDNYVNQVAGPNENFARELFELHTLGAENYFGVARQNEVPIDGEGYPIAYVDDDIYEATRCFTGWRVNDGSSGAPNTGTFFYDDTRHDRFQKTVLGLYIPSDQAAMEDGYNVLDRLANHPGTAQFVCRKLCRRFVSDTPAQSLVDGAAAIFRAQVAAPDQLKQVVRYILLSDAFKNTWEAKIKRPFESIISGLRAANTDFNLLNDGEGDTFLWYYDQIGQPLYQWRAPTGYSDLRKDWQGTTPMVQRWRVSAWLSDLQVGGNYVMDVLAETPLAVRSANALADFWIDRFFGRPLPAADRQEIVEFMAQGFNPDYDLPLDTDTDTQERLHTMIGLLMQSPEFQFR